MEPHQEGLPLLPSSLSSFSEACTPEEPSRRHRERLLHGGRRICLAAVATAATALAGAGLARQAATVWHRAQIADAIQAQARGKRCRQLAIDDICYQAVRWSRDIDILLHPDLYEGLTRDSSLEDFQSCLARTKPDSQCLPPCLQAFESRAPMQSLPARGVAMGFAASQHDMATTNKTTTAGTTTTVATVASTTRTSTTTFTTNTITAGRGNSTADVIQFYLYRAQSHEDYPFENLNAADLGGVLWYLQNEVLTMCPRKNNISRVIRLRATTRRSFMPYVAFDDAKCTVPECGELWREHGYKIGCQELGDYGGIKSRWFSLPGPCPSSTFRRKSAACRAAEPGGACRRLADVFQPGASNCTYYIEQAGDVDINQVTGIRNYTELCARGGLEYDKTLDRGRLLNFWDGLADPAKSAARIRRFEQSFQATFPQLPWNLEIPSDGICR